MPVSTSDRPRLVKADVIADIVGMSTRWVLVAAQRGEIPHVRLGRNVRFDPAAVEAWWRDRTDGPQLADAA